MIKVGVAGATGYAGEEIIKILLGHNNVRITKLQRNLAALDKAENFSSIFPAYKGKIDLVCGGFDPAEMAKDVDVAFLALPHKISMEFAPVFLKAGKRVIDLSADYRLTPDMYKVWYGVDHKDPANLPLAVYGLPELYADKVRTAQLLANPGCYPTSIILGIAPALAAKAVRTDILIADAKSGVSGAGRKADVALLFGEVNENLKAYRVNDHQHKPEINRFLSALAGSAVDVIFTPHLIPMNRGILSTIYLKLLSPMTTKDALRLYTDFYRGKPFVRISDEGKMPQIRDVAMTNYCDIGVKVTGDTLIVVSCIDNLMKGAAGQAVQNMNIMFGFAETEALS